MNVYSLTRTNHAAAGMDWKERPILSLEREYKEEV